MRSTNIPVAKAPMSAFGVPFLPGPEVVLRRLGRPLPLIPRERPTLYYLELFQSLNQAHVRYLVAGGVALNLHGVPRMTADLDLALALDEPNLGAAVTALEGYGMASSLPVAARELVDPEKRRKWLKEKGLIAFPMHHPLRPFQAVDLLVNAPIEFEGAWTRRVVLDVAGTPVPVLGAGDLLALKRAAGRPQDLADADALERLIARKRGAP